MSGWVSEKAKYRLPDERPKISTWGKTERMKRSIMQSQQSFVVGRRYGPKVICGILPSVLLSS